MVPSRCSWFRNCSVSWIFLRGGEKQRFVFFPLARKSPRGSEIVKCPSWKGPTGIKKGLGNAVRHRVWFWGGPGCSWAPPSVWVPCDSGCPAFLQLVLGPRIAGIVRLRWKLLLWELRPGCKEKKAPSRGTTSPKAWVKRSHCSSVSGGPERGERGLGTWYSGGTGSAGLAGL